MTVHTEEELEGLKAAGRVVRGRAAIDARPPSPA